MDSRDFNLLDPFLDSRHCTHIVHIHAHKGKTFTHIFLEIIKDVPEVFFVYIFFLFLTSSFSVLDLQLRMRGDCTFKPLK